MLLKYAKSATACGLLAGVALTANAATTTISLVEMADLHAHLIPHKALVLNGAGQKEVGIRGGVTRIATAIKQVRASNPNTVVMSVGDTFHGGVEGLFSAGNSIVGPVNALGIDVGVAGNWDFYYTPPLIRMRYGVVNTAVVTMPIPGMDAFMPIKQPNYPNLGANIQAVTDIMPVRDFMPPTLMKTVGGIKIGFIGLTTDILEDMHPMLAAGFVFTQGESAYRDLVNKHAADLRRQGANYVVVMSELGLHKSKRLADVVNAGSVNAFFVGHTHETTFTPIVAASGALVVEPGGDSFLGRMDAAFDVTTSVLGKKTVTLKSQNWKLMPMDASVAEDSAMRAMVDAERAQYLRKNVFIEAPPFVMQTLTRPIDTVIGKAETLIDRQGSLDSRFNAGWTDMLREMTGTQIAITPGFRMGEPIPGHGEHYEDGAVASGDITIEDAYRFFPMAYSIATAESNGAHIRKVIEGVLTRTFSPDDFNKRGGWNYGYSGLDIDVDLAAPDNQRIRSIRYSDTGAPVAPTDKLTVTGCRRTPIEFDGYLCAIPGFTNIAPVIGGSPVPGFDAMPIQAVDMFEKALAVRAFDGDRHTFNDLNNTPMWPDADFITPMDGPGTPTGANGPESCGLLMKMTCNGATFTGFSIMGYTTMP
ncbi:MAG: 5'-nucleotidase C-terminal domain-containing protein [Thiobacillus sp.]